MSDSLVRNTYYALRHGHSEKNDLDLVVSYPEARSYHLSKKGRAQVREGAEWLRDKNINHIFASDLTRARESAEIVADVLGLVIEYDTRLREVDFGTYNDRTHEDLWTFFNNHEDFQERFDRAPEGGETWRDVVHRVLEFLSEIERRLTDKNILLVSHGDPLWLLQWGSQCVTIDALDSIPYPETGFPMKLSIKCAPTDHVFSSGGNSKDK